MSAARDVKSVAAGVDGPQTIAGNRNRVSPMRADGSTSDNPEIPLFMPRIIGTARIPGPRTANGAAPARAADPAQAVGVARIPSPINTTRPFRPGTIPPPRPVFSDDTGRRRRTVQWIAVLLALLGLVLTAALWLSQTPYAIRTSAPATCITASCPAPRAGD
jgi:hypothetical protein